jgi:hypothetical protein
MTLERPAEPSSDGAVPRIEVPGFDLRVVPTADATPEERALMHALFDTNYRQANHPYLDKSFGVLRFAAIAMNGDTAAGFALGDMRVVDLPRLPQQAVAMAGICCVAPEYRRRGLFGALEMLAMSGAGAPPPGRILSVGRMAHPASMRTMSRQPSAVPKLGAPLTPWQRAIGRAIADLYGTARFDDQTFVCVGSGTPIGYPVIELEVEPAEWRLFEPVDRDRGDSLLGIGWRPDPPEGWHDLD